MHHFSKDYFYGGKISNYSDYGKINPSRQFDNIIAFVKNNNLSGNILDLGCAFGLLLNELKPFFKNLYGCDISKYAIRKAKKIIPQANLKVVDLNKTLPYSNEFFDCISALDVLEHTQNIEVNLAKIVPLLKGDGILFLSLPIKSWPIKFFGFLDRDKTHISVLKDNQVIEIIKKHNLAIISRKYYCYAPNSYKISGIPCEMELILKKTQI